MKIFLFCKKEEKIRQAEFQPATYGFLLDWTTTVHLSNNWAIEVVSFAWTQYKFFIQFTDE